jgi:hypothetical protein
LKYRAADRRVGQWADDTKALVAALGGILQSGDTLGPRGFAEDDTDILSKKVDAFAVTFVGPKCLSVKATIIRRVIAVDVSGFDEIGLSADCYQMADDALNDALTLTAETLCERLPIIRVFERTCSVVDVHRNSFAWCWLNAWAFRY